MSQHASSSINPAAVRAYDLRGVVGRELGPDDAHALGLAYAIVALERNFRDIAVARDGRLTSPELERALLRGLVSGGLRVTCIGVAPTPELYFAVHALGLDGGIMVTGSHNPPDQNGFKLLLGGHPIYGEALRQLVRTPPTTRAGGRTTQRSMGSAYAAALKRVASRLPPCRVVWDCGNGAVGAMIEALTSQLPGEHLLLNATVDGRFPAHHPDPAVAKNLDQLRHAVIAERADLGIAFDGDGDRIGVVDGTGTIVWPDQLLLLLAEERLRRDRGATIVADVKSSGVLFERIVELGGHAVMAPSGYVLIREAMLARGAPLAGEMSGHIVFAEAWHGADDALFAALYVLKALASRQTSLAAFRQALPARISTPEMRLKCADARKHGVVREIAGRLWACGAQIDTTDGIRVTRPDGWWLLRASGTEAKLTARCEARDDVALQHLQRELASQLALSNVPYCD